MILVRTNPTPHWTTADEAFLMAGSRNLFMISNSFIFLDRIGDKSEENIWKQGIRCWDDFLNADKVKGMSAVNKFKHDAVLKHAKKALFDYDSSFFSSLNSSERWRLYDFFRDDCVFVDLETDGRRNITVITLFDGIDTKTLVRNVNLSKSVLEKELSKYKIIISFNGSSYDLPTIKSYFGNILPKIPHIDLFGCCRKLKLEGGLKSVEEKLSISRPAHLNPKNEGNPVCLWKAFHASGDVEYLNTLIKYNEEDVINLKPLMEYCYRRLSEKMRMKLNVV
jgi:uncharacterized protein YprB with RNaseH-like and TPR domain